MNKAREFLLINFGLLLVALGIHLFKIPNNFATGGVSGLAIITSHFFPKIPVGSFMFIINAILLIIGFTTINFEFGSKTVYSSFALSGMVWVLGEVFPVHKPLTGDTFLELVYAIILPAVGSAIVFNQNASTGGTDIVAKILTKYTQVHIGKTLLMADFIITVMAGVVFGIKVGMYSVLGLILKAFIVDLAIEGMNVCKQMAIISSRTEDIKNFIIGQMGRGATVYKATGAYTNEERDVITTVVTRRQAIKLRRYIREIDNKAFITITNTSEIIGKGFRNVDL